MCRLPFRKRNAIVQSPSRTKTASSIWKLAAKSRLRKNSPKLPRPLVWLLSGSSDTRAAITHGSNHPYTNFRATVAFCQIASRPYVGLGGRNQCRHPAQELAPHEPHERPPMLLPEPSPPLLMATNLDSKRCAPGVSHLGHVVSSSALPKLRSSSNLHWQWSHTYSYTGILLTP